MSSRPLARRKPTMPRSKVGTTSRTYRSLLIVSRHRHVDLHIIGRVRCLGLYVPRRHLGSTMDHLGIVSRSVHRLPFDGHFVRSRSIRRGQSVSWSRNGRHHCNRLSLAGSSIPGAERPKCAQQALTDTYRTGGDRQSSEPRRTRCQLRYLLRPRSRPSSMAHLRLLVCRRLHQLALPTCRPRHSWHYRPGFHFLTSRVPTV